MDNIKTYREFINEGMFDNGIKRAHTKEVRQEDDVNLFDVNDFGKYINKIYCQKDNREHYVSHYCNDGHGHETLYVIPWTISWTNGDEILHLSITYETDGITGSRITMDNCFQKMFDKYPELDNILKQKYILKDVIENEKYNVHRLYIEPRKGTICNRMYLDILNDIIDNVNDSVIDRDNK